MIALALLMASPMGPPPKPHVLISTWFGGAQVQPQTTQTPFSSLQSCLKARAAIMADAQRIEQEIEARRRADELRGIISNPIIPRVSAICAAR